MYRVKENFPTPVLVLVPAYTKTNGVTKKTLPDDGELIFCKFKSYGGTETNINGVYSIVDTASVETWYNPKIKSDCAIKLENGAIYEIINEPENVEMRNKIMKFKVRRVKGNG
mgnify:FL=1